MNRRYALGYGVSLFWYIGIPIILVLDQYFSSFYPTVTSSMGYFIPIALYVWMLGNVVLTVKIPTLQRFFPYDTRIQLHILSSFGIICFVLVHAFTKIFSGYVIDILTWSLFALIVILFLLSWYWIRIPVFSVVRWIMRVVFKHDPSREYDLLKIIHQYGFYLLTVLMYIHVNNSSIEEKGSILSGTLYFILFASTLILLAYSFIRRLRRHRGTVTGIEKKEESFILHVTLDRPLRYRAGQFAYLQFPKIKTLVGSHPFSFLSSPQQGKTIVSFGIKISGDFTERLANVPLGSMVRIDGAYGAFCPNSNEKICLVGTGIGVVPLMSILTSREYSPHSLFAIFSIRNAKEFPSIYGFQPEISSEQEEFKAHRTDSGLIGNMLCLETSQQSRISSSHFAKLPGNASDYVYYICSSPTVRNSIVSILRLMGVSKTRIVFENFSY